MKGVQLACMIALQIRPLSLMSCVQTGPILLAFHLGCVFVIAISMLVIFAEKSRVLKPFTHVGC